MTSYRPAWVALLAFAVGLAETATAEVPLIGDRASAAIVLTAIRVAETASGEASDNQVAGKRSGSLAQSALDRRHEGCHLAGLDGWDADRVNSVWQCQGGRVEKRLYRLRAGRVEAIDG